MADWCHTFHEVGYIAWAVCISSTRSALVEALISLFLSHVESNTIQPKLYVLPSLEEVLSQNLSV